MSEKKILIVEDEFTARTLLEFQLKRLRISFDSVENGGEALSCFQKGKYSLVLLDEYLPDLNGSEVARKILEIEPGVPLFAMTGDSEAVPRLKREGFQDVFLKPLHGKGHLDIILGYLT